jgi:hypothetical protein
VPQITVREIAHWRLIKTPARPPLIDLQWRIAAYRPAMALTWPNVYMKHHATAALRIWPGGVANLPAAATACAAATR